MAETGLDLYQDFLNLGWLHFKFDSHLLDWVNHALPYAREAVASPSNAHWRRCGGTWFVGVNLLPNDQQGRIGDSGPISGEAISFLRRNFDFLSVALDKAQISVCYPEYPKPSTSESESSYRYRLRRNGAHIDGLHALGSDRRRYLKEHHAFVLGIPMSEFSADAAPPMVWECSHEAVRSAFAELYSHIPHEKWSELDVTNRYHALRKEIFERCSQRTLRLQKGECFLIHRLALHGIAKWSEQASADPDGRMICYFRPQFANPQDWLCAP